MVVSSNLLAMNAQRQFNINTKSKQKSTEKLSSGYRINRSADDAAGLAISEKMRRQIRGLTQGVKNTQDGISLCQVADGALDEVDEMLHRITELSVKAANDTNMEEDRRAIQQEINQIISEIDRISDTTTFNNRKLFVGDSVTHTVPVEISIPNIVAENIRNGIKSSLSITGEASRNSYIVTADENGIKLDGSSIPFDQITSTTGSTFDEDDIRSGQYSFTKNGMTISFSITSNASRQNVLDAINGLKIPYRLESISYDPIQLSNFDFTNVDDSTFWVPTSGASTSYSFRPSETGLKLVKYNEGGIADSLIETTWASLGYDIENPENNNGKTFTFTDLNTGMKFDFRIHENGSDIISDLRGKSLSIDFGSNTHSTSSILTDSDYMTISDTYKQHLALGLKPNQYISATYSLIGDDADNAKMRLTAQNGNYLDFDFESYSVGSVPSVTFKNAETNLSIKYISRKISSGPIISEDTWFDIMKSKQPFYFEVLPSGFRTSHNIDRNMKYSYVKGDPSFISDIPPIRQTIYEDVEEEIPQKLWIQSGSEAGVGMYLEIDAMNTKLLGIKNLNVSTQSGAGDAIDAVKGALEKVSSNRSKIGAQQNRLEHTIANENNIIENTTAAESKIRDTDMAKEMEQLSLKNILEQAGISMMTQANQSNQSVLQLLQ